MAVAESTAMEMALVGPLINCRLLAKNARHYHRGVQAVLRRYAGYQCIRYGLGHRYRGNGKSRQQISARHMPVVLA